jgi:hypothetical protein
MMVLLVFGILASVRGVAADHIESPEFAEESSAARFEQYLWALDLERLHSPAYTMSSVDRRMGRLDRFGQYSLALELQEQARQARFTDELASESNASPLARSSNVAVLEPWLHEYLRSIGAIRTESTSSTELPESWGQWETYLWASGGSR